MVKGDILNNSVNKEEKQGAGLNFPKPAISLQFKDEGKTNLKDKSYSPAPRQISSTSVSESQNPAPLSFFRESRTELIIPFFLARRMIPRGPDEAASKGHGTPSRLPVIHNRPAVRIP
jgi:hypothetical protein